MADNNLLFFFLFLFVAASSSQVEDEQIIPIPRTAPVKVLFLENGLLEHAWTYRHDIGRFLVAAEYRDHILTSVEVADEWDDANSIELVSRYIANGYEMIFFTSSGWIGVSQELAAMFPHVFFVQNPGWDFSAGNSTLTNLVGIDSQLYQAYYLAGIIGGHMSKTEKLGFLNGQPFIPVTQSSANAYCVGARSINPKITCHQIMMGEWTDVRKHRQGTKQLLDFGCDHVISVTGNYHPDFLVAEAFQDGNEVYSCGFADDFRVKVGPSVTSSAVFFWEQVYGDLVRQYVEHSDLGGIGISQVGMNDGVVDAAPPSDIVPQEAISLFLSEREKLLAASDSTEIVFCGEQALEGIPADIPINNETGCISPAEMGNMGYQMGFMWTVEPKFYFNHVFVESDDLEYIALIVVVSILSVISLIYLVLVLIYWDTPVILVASPVFLIALFIGAWLQFISSYLYLQEPSNGTCMTSVWLDTIGLQIMISAIAVKNYRLYMMFRNSRKFFPVKISNLELMSVLALGVMGVVAILVGFQVSAPYEPETELLPLDENPTFDQVYLFCGSEDEGLFIALIWGYLSAWLLGCVVLAYLTRKLDGLLCESNSLALAIYNIVIIELIFLPLIYTFESDQYQGKTVLLTLQPTYRAFMTLSFLLLPKFYIAVITPEENKAPTRSTTGIANHTMDD